MWHHSLQVMNCFDKTKAAIFPIQAMLPKDFLFYLDYPSYVF